MTLSTTKNRLFLGGIPWDASEEYLTRRLRKEVVGIEEVEVPMARLFSPRPHPRPGRSCRVSDPHTSTPRTLRAQRPDSDPPLNKGMAFVSFYNNQCASKAHDKLSSASFAMAGRHPTVKWAEPRKVTEADLLAAQNVKNVYVTGFPEGTTQEQLTDAFAQYGEVERVFLNRSRPEDKGPKKVFAFVHFKERAAACAAADAPEKPEVGGRRVNAELARPEQPRPQPNASQGPSLGFLGGGARGPGGGIAPRGVGRGPPPPQMGIPPPRPPSGARHRPWISLALSPSLAPCPASPHPFFSCPYLR